MLQDPSDVETEGKAAMQQIRQVALDLTNSCSKNCWFCYNGSHAEGNTMWTPSEVISFALDCHASGVEAFSLGGGEPLEYDGLFEIIDGIKDELYTTVTSNGLRLEDSGFFREFMNHLPDKIHISIHFPEIRDEVERVILMVKRLEAFPVKSGVNLLVSTQNIDYVKSVFEELERRGVSRDRVIILPMKYRFCPSPEQIRDIIGGRPFQSPSCLLGCKRPEHYCSVTWNKMVCPCSYSPSKVELEKLTYEGLVDALSKVRFKSCL